MRSSSGMPFGWSRNRDGRRPRLRRASGLEWISSIAGGVKCSVKGTSHSRARAKRPSRMSSAGFGNLKSSSRMPNLTGIY